MQPDLDSLLPPMAQQLSHVVETTLATFGTFCVFGAGITRDGKVVHYAARDGDQPDAELRRLSEELGRRHFILGIILVNTRMVPPGTSEETDAVWWIHEARDGEIIHSFLPYEVTDRGVTYGDSFRVPEPVPVIYGG